MEFKVEMNNIDYSDSKLIKALETISDSVEYKVVISNTEIEELIGDYVEKVLDIDLEVSGIYVDAGEQRLYYENIFEAAVIINQLLQHFGMNAICAGGSSESLDYYQFNLRSFMLKMSKFGYLESYGDYVQLTFDQADEFTNTWIYKYIQTKKER